MLLIGRAHAQDSQAEARARFDEGVRHAQALEWEPALQAFRASLALYDRARTLFNVVVALDRLGRGPECMAAIDRLLARSDTDAGDRAQADELAARWRSRLATLVIDLDPPAATLRIDGAELAGEGALRRAYLPPGPHEIAAQSSGSEPRRTSYEASAGASERIAIHLARAAAGSAIALRPLDRATVRLIALRGAGEMAVYGSPLMVVVQAQRASGVIVQEDGWILTVRHAVEGADRVVALLPGEERAIAARVMWLDPAHDLALVRMVESSSEVVPLETGIALELGQALDLSSYPIDRSERSPGAGTAQLGRALNDGRVQLAITLGEGSPGAPVMAAGHLVGVLSEGGGGQPMAVMEPIAPALLALGGLLGAPFDISGTDPADDVLAELSGAASPAPMVRRIARLSEAEHGSYGDARAALYALEADAMRRQILVDARAIGPFSLAPDARTAFDEATRLSAQFALRALEQPALAVRYGALRSLALAVPMMTVAPRAQEPQAPSGPPLFELSIGGGLAIDERQGPIMGGSGRFAGLWHLGNIGALDPFRFNVLAGADVLIGGWRSSLAVAGLADMGVELAIGTPNISIVIALMYTPGVSLAEGRWHFAYLAYRAVLALQLGTRFRVGVSWQEIGRVADDTERSLDAFIAWELGG